MAAAPASRYHQLTVEIEHCVDCEEHLHITHHDATKYEEYAKKVQNAVLAAMPGRLNILINPRPDLGRKGQLQFHEDPYCHHFYIVRDLAGAILRKFRYPHLGSFEVYLHNPFVNQKLCVFSKLTVGKWPNADVVAARIQRALGAGPSVSFFLFKERQPSASTSRQKPHESKVQDPVAIVKGRRGQSPQKRLLAPPTRSKKTASPTGTALPESVASEATASNGTQSPTVETGAQRPPLLVVTGPRPAAPATPPTEAEDLGSEKEGKKKKKKDKLQSSSSTIAEEGDLKVPSDDASKKKKKHKDGLEGSSSTTLDKEKSAMADGESPGSRKKKKKKKADGHELDASHSEAEQSVPNTEEDKNLNRQQSKTKLVSSDSLAETGGEQEFEKQTSSHSVQDASVRGGARGHKKSKHKEVGEASATMEKNDSEVERKKGSKSPSVETLGSPGPEIMSGPADANPDDKEQQSGDTGEDDRKAKEGQDDAENETQNDSHLMGSEENHETHKKDKKKREKRVDADTPEEKGGHEGERRHKEGKKKRESGKDTKATGGKKRSDSSDALNKKKGKKHGKEKGNLDSHTNEASDERHTEGEEATKHESEVVPAMEIKDNKKEADAVDGGGEGDKDQNKGEGEQTTEDLDSEKPPDENMEKRGKAPPPSPPACDGQHPLAPVTKQYELCLPIGAKKTQKLSYENPGDQPRNFRLVSSHPKAMELKSPEVTVEPRGKVKLGLTFSEVLMPTVATYYLYIYDKDTDELQECVQIKGEYVVS